MPSPHWRQFFQNREADLAWPERSKGTKVPAYEEASSSSAPHNQSQITNNSSFSASLSDLCGFAVQTLPLLFSIYPTLDPSLGCRLNVSAPKSLSPIRNFPFTNHP
jgi:hypothetical protein